MPNNFYRYTIEDIVCTALKDANKKCEIKSELRFKQKVQFIDLEGALSLNDSDIADHVNNLLLQENTMDINKIVEFFNKKPLKNLDIVVNDSSLTSIYLIEFYFILKCHLIFTIIKIWTKRSYSRLSKTVVVSITVQHVRTTPIAAQI